MSQPKPATRICGACNRTRLSGYNPGTICGPCQRALFAQQNPSDPGGRDDPAAWVWGTVPMRNALARLDFPAVLVIYLSAARLSRRELAERTGLSESTIWRFEAGERQGIYDIRQLLQFADSVAMPRPALLPVILGEPRALNELLAGPLIAAPRRQAHVGPGMAGERRMAAPPGYGRAGAGARGPGRAHAVPAVHRPGTDHAVLLARLAVISKRPARRKGPLK